MHIIPLYTARASMISWLYIMNKSEWGKKGATLRHLSLTPERRSEIAKIAAKKSAEIRSAKAKAKLSTAVLLHKY